MTLSPDIQQQRYAAIELAYSERRWLDVEQLSRTLLGELPDDRRDPLALRVVLLLGHTRLYGFGDSSLARRHYSTVLEHSEEQTLRDIADQGLRQCTLLAEPDTSVPSRSATEAGIPAAEPSEPGAAAAPAATAATPWLTEHEMAGPRSQAAGASVPVGADASPWLTPNVSDSTSPPSLRDGGKVAAQVPSDVPSDVSPDGPSDRVAGPATIGEVALAEVIEEPDQVEVALAANRQDPLELIATSTSPAMQPLQEGQLEPEQSEEERPEAPLLLAGVRSVDAAGAPGSQPGQTPDALDALRRGLLRLKLD